MQIPYFQIDAFTSQVFKGNPAGVCPLEKWLPDDILLAIAAENNLSETAFFIPTDEGYQLRWFTPLVEVDLCGHATLATSFVLFNEPGYNNDTIRFTSISGKLTVRRHEQLISMDFPARPPGPCTPPADLLIGLGSPPVETLMAEDYLVIFNTADQILNLQPQMEYLSRFPRGVIASAPGKDCDFVSRFFAPSLGVPEDPVTGSAHCVLVPYWSQRLGKSELKAHQISARGGELFCTAAGERTIIAGQAVKYLAGTITI